MRAESRQGAWTTIGATLLLAGVGGFVPLVIWAQGSPNLHLWESRLFDAIILVCAMGTLAGAYALFSPVFGWPIPAARAARATEPLVIRAARARSALSAHGSKPERRLLKKTPEELTAMCANLTSLQAKRLVAPYIGEWIEVEGSVDNVNATSDDFGSLRIDGRLVAMYFDGPEWVKRLELLSRGDHVTVQGKIREITLSCVDLQEGEII